MTLEEPICSICGSPAAGISETIQCTALIGRKEDGSFDFAGETKVHWDTQKAPVDGDKRARVECENGHEWPTRIAR